MKDIGTSWLADTDEAEKGGEGIRCIGLGGKRDVQAQPHLPTQPG